MKTIPKIFIIGFIGALLLAGGSWLKDKSEADLWLRSEKIGNSVLDQLPDEIKPITESLILMEKSIPSGKNYKSVLKTIDPVSKYEYWVDEYVAPGNQKGYQIYLKKPSGSTMSFGEGVESNIRSFNWTKILIFATSTP